MDKLDMEDINIRIVVPGDLAQLQKISRDTFIETFATGNTEANMNQYLDKSFSTAQLAAELGDRSSVFYFAMLGKKIIGYLKLNADQSQTEIQDEDSLEIERIYVLKEYHGFKVGQLLYEKALQHAKEKNVKYIWLGVWDQNLRAINFYKKNGFIEFDKHVFKLGDDEQIDIMMKLTF